MFGIEDRRNRHLDRLAAPAEMPGHVRRLVVADPVFAGERAADITDLLHEPLTEFLDLLQFAGDAPVEEKVGMQIAVPGVQDAERSDTVKRLEEAIVWDKGPERGLDLQYGTLEFEGQMLFRKSSDKTYKKKHVMCFQQMILVFKRENNHDAEYVVCLFMILDRYTWMCL